LAGLLLSTHTGHPIAEMDSREAVNGGDGRDRGLVAGSRCMKSGGDIARCVVPSRQGVLSLGTT
jgi:hypothetical protein